jgi:hypothetical protein
MERFARHLGAIAVEVEADFIPGSRTVHRD